MTYDNSDLLFLMILWFTLVVLLLVWEHFCGCIQWAVVDGLTHMSETLAETAGMAGMT